MGEIKSRLFEKDVKWIIFFNIKLKCKFFDKTLPVFTYLGGVAVMVLVCLFLICIGSPNDRTLGIETMLSLIASHVAVQVLKRIFQRKRSKDELLSLNKFYCNTNKKRIILTFKGLI